jgi:hypothetical protein
MILSNAGGPTITNGSVLPYKAIEVINPGKPK